jgi:uncharacterized membrane protein
MKKIIYFLTMLISLALFTNCSNDDKNSNSSLTQMEQQLVGKWNTSPNLTGNTYEYKADKTAVYINTWTNGSKAEVTIYKGAWKMIDGNVLIEYYPDEDEAWDENWQQKPTLKNKIEFTNSNTVKQTDFYNSNSVNTHYKQK